MTKQSQEDATAYDGPLYEVLSDNFARPLGSVLREDELDGLNIEALISAGHIAAHDRAEAGPPPAEIKEQ